MKLKRGDGYTMKSITALVRVLRRLRWTEGLSSPERLIVDHAVRAIRRAPRVPGRGRISIVALGFEDTRLTVTTYSSGVHVEFERSSGDRWTSLYGLSVRRDGEADEAGDFRDLVALNEKYKGNWVKSAKVEYAE